MGIKFHCPQGHKLNVKAFLAGKKGICPKCGTKLRIPDASEPALLDSEDDESDDAGAEATVKSNGAGAVAAVAHVPAPAVSAGPAPTVAASANDPIAEAPAAIWYVRPPTGGQYGPARGDVMRKWLTEGRVSSDSLVWREGWTDWQNAGKLFPSLGDSAAATAVQSVAPVVSTTAPISARASQRVAAPRSDAQKRNSNTMAIAILASLGLLCVILIIVLVFVVLRMSSTAA